MALQINDTSYSGTFASAFWLPATFGMDTVQKGAVFVQDGIKKSHTIGRMDFTQPLQTRAATPTSGGTFTVDGRVLTPKDMMLYTEFNPRDYEAHWMAEQLSPRILDRSLPITAENYMMQVALNRTFEPIETGIWMGSTTYSATPGTAGNGQICFFDGFFKKFLHDNNIHKVPSPLPLSADASSSSVYNIADAMDALLKSAANNKKALLSRASRYELLKFYMSIDSEQIWQTFITTSQTFKGVNTTERGINRYKGYEIVPLAGFPDDSILFCEGLPDTSSNLYLGMNSTEDNNLQLMRLQNNSELFFLKGLMKYDVQYGFSEEIFLFTTLSASAFTA